MTVKSRDALNAYADDFLPDNTTRSTSARIIAIT